MEGASKSKVVIASQLAHARVEFAVVNKTTGFVDDEERKDDPVPCQTCQYILASVTHMLYNRKCKRPRSHAKL